MRRERQIIFHGQYFQEFYLKINDGVREKIGYVFRVIETVDKVPEKFLKHIEGTERFLGIDSVKPFVVQNLGKYERQQWMNAEFETQSSPPS